MKSTQTLEIPEQEIEPALVLVVDDEPSICWAFDRMLSPGGHEVVAVSSAEDGLAFLQRRKPQLVMLDVRLPGEDGISALPKFLEQSEGVPVIVMTAFGDLETAVSAIRLGATDYITKPFGLDEIQRACSEALSSQATREKQAHGSADSSSDEVELIGSSPAMQNIFKQIALVASSDLAVLITGETGTGKELVAAAIHRHSQRANEPYLPVAPVALNSDLIESELFGHVKGAFTGALQDRRGIFEQADGGTVLLDEIGELPLGTQAKLLRVLDQQEYFRVGDTKRRRCNVRILAATNCDLRAAVEQGNFRKDLFYRLHGLRMHLPPLRERKEDIPALCEHFLKKLSYPHYNRLHASMTSELVGRAWYGNVRELKNAVNHAVVVARGRPLRTSDFPSPEPNRSLSADIPLDANLQLERAVADWFEHRISLSEGDSSGLYQEVLDRIEPTLFSLALEQTSGNRSKAADLLGMHRGTLRQKLAARPQDHDDE